ncbi:MAG: hypothetical protein AAGH99_01640 [Planctomycetota bacterium]
MPDADPPPVTEADTVDATSPEAPPTPDAEEENIELAASEVEPSEASTNATEDTTAPPPKKPKVVLCPYCGSTQPHGDRCVSCGGLFEPLSRRATQIAMGPWTVRNKAQPFRPGCSYEVLVGMIERGQVGPMTVLRGPTTRQFWSVARNVPGVAHLLGYCHACGAHVDPKDKRCSSCDAVFRRVRQRNELGLQFPNRRDAEAAQRSLNRLLGITPAGADEEEAADQEATEAALTEDQAQVEAAAAAVASSGDQAAESIFEQGAAAANPEDDAPNDLISDLLGDVATRPAAAPKTPSPEEVLDTAPPMRAETPSPLPAATPAAPPNPAALPPRREINWLVVGLVALNVIVATAAIVYFAIRSTGG